MSTGSVNNLPKMTDRDYKHPYRKNETKNFPDSKPKVEGKDVFDSDSAKNFSNHPLDSKYPDSSKKERRSYQKPRTYSIEKRPQISRNFASPSHASKLTLSSLPPSSSIPPKYSTSPIRNSRKTDDRDFSSNNYSSKNTYKNSSFNKTKPELEQDGKKINRNIQRYPNRSNKDQYSEKKQSSDLKKNFVYSLDFMRSLRSSPLVKPPNSVVLLPIQKYLSLFNLASDQTQRNSQDKLSEHIYKATKAASARNEFQSQLQKKPEGLWRDENALRAPLKTSQLKSNYYEAKDDLSGSYNNESVPEWMDYNPSQYPDDYEIGLQSESIESGYFSSNGIPPLDQNLSSSFNNFSAYEEESSVKSRFLSLFGDKNITPNDNNAPQSADVTSNANYGDPEQSGSGENVDKLFRMFGSKIQNPKNTLDNSEKTASDLTEQAQPNSMVDRLFGLMNTVNSDNSNNTGIADIPKKIKTPPPISQAQFTSVSTINEAFRGIVPTSVLRKNIQQLSNNPEIKSEYLKSSESTPKILAQNIDTNSKTDSPKPISNQSNLPEWLLALAVGKTSTSLNSSNRSEVSKNSETQNDLGENPIGNRTDSKHDFKAESNSYPMKNQFRSTSTDYTGSKNSLSKKHSNRSSSKQSKDSLSPLNKSDSSRKLNKFSTDEKNDISNEPKSLLLNTNSDSLIVSEKKLPDSVSDNSEKLNSDSTTVPDVINSDSKSSSKDITKNISETLKNISLSQSKSQPIQNDTDSINADSFGDKKNQSHPVSSVNSNLLGVEDENYQIGLEDSKQQNLYDIQLGGQDMQMPFYPLHNMNIPGAIIPNIFQDQHMIDPILAQHQFMLQNEQMMYLHMNNDQAFNFNHNNPNFMPYNIPNHIQPDMQFMPLSNDISPIPSTPFDQDLLNNKDRDTSAAKTTHPLNSTQCTNNNINIDHEGPIAHEVSSESKSTIAHGINAEKSDDINSLNQNINFSQQPMFYPHHNQLNFGNSINHVDPSILPVGFQTPNMFLNPNIMPNIGYFPFQMNPQNNIDPAIINSNVLPNNFHNYNISGQFIGLDGVSSPPQAIISEDSNNTSLPGNN
ncbi:hypothetical protein AYI70_g5680 [Smittium culicis]|uniref:Uncharacterized protein n=1 Tax=Smittium culicis TaxID=133412 RepID=A0A1R1XTA5_9FUNG|nr:hypothetical protein AYI70_g5680 [Smittium culicis]